MSSWSFLVEGQTHVRKIPMSKSNMRSNALRILFCLGVAASSSADTDQNVAMGREANLGAPRIEITAALGIRYGDAASRREIIGSVCGADPSAFRFDSSVLWAKTCPRNRLLSG
jgi:hypothetical protein